MQNVKALHSNWLKIATRLSSLVAGASLVVGTVAVEVMPANAAPAKPSAQPTSLPDGVYLYGQSAKPDEIGQGYFVFESKQGQVVGALYYPQSSFDCAKGSFKNEQLALSVTNSYDGITNPFEIALDRNSTVASNGEPVVDLGLQGFHKLDKVTDNDLRMLNVCKVDMQKQAKAVK